MTAPSRRIAALLSTFAVGLTALFLAAAPAQATAYRYWSYWQGATGQWVAASTGPAGYTVVDQDVQGWRFGITTDAPVTPPDDSPDFVALCPEQAAGEPPAGQVRVAVVVDPGFVADAPSGQTPPADKVSCVGVPAGSTGSQALATAVAVTEKTGMVCAINGYPAAECSPAVSDSDAAAAAQAAATETPNPALAAADTGSDTATTSNLGLLTGVGVVAMVALLLGIVVVNRRRSADIQE